MSDDDRLADYLRRMDGDNTRRTLPDGCTSCGVSLVSCHSVQHFNCCDHCDHEGVK